MNTKTMSLEKYFFADPLPSVAPTSGKRTEQKVAQYSRWLVVLLVIAGIAIVAYVDALVRALSLGFLYIFPLAFGAVVLKRRVALWFVLLCVFLVDWLGPYEHVGWHLLWRNLISLTGFLAVVLVVSQLVQQRRSLAETVQQQRDEMTKDIAQAALIQRRMLPQQVPLRDGIELAARMQSAKVVAGDYYDFIELAGGNLGLVVADVAGKGVPAGLLTPTIKAVLRLEGPRLQHSHDVVASLNQLIYDVTDEARYATLFYAILKPSARTLEYTNAGHLPGLWYRAATRDIVWLEKGGLSAGLFEGLPYEREQVQLGQGDILALYSDGISEAESPRGEEFTRERLGSLIAAHATLTAEALLGVIFATLGEFTAQQPSADDQTLLICKVS